MLSTHARSNTVMGSPHGTGPLCLPAAASRYCLAGWPGSGGTGPASQAAVAAGAAPIVPVTSGPIAARPYAVSPAISRACSSFSGTSRPAARAARIAARASPSMLSGMESGPNPRAGSACR